MSKTWRLLVLLVLVIALIWYWRNRRAPDQRLVEHLEAICDIAEDNADQPRRGVDRLFDYLADNTPAMMHDGGALLVAIEGIADDERHDARAREAAARLHAPVIECAADLQRFAQAIEADPEASAKFQRGVERMSRTLSILLGQKGARAAALGPAALVHAFE